MSNSIAQSLSDIRKTLINVKKTLIKTLRRTNNHSKIARKTLIYTKKSIKLLSSNKVTQVQDKKSSDKKLSDKKSLACISIDIINNKIVPYLNVKDLMRLLIVSKWLRNEIIIKSLVSSEFTRKMFNTYKFHNLTSLDCTTSCSFIKRASVPIHELKSLTSLKVFLRPYLDLSKISRLSLKTLHYTPWNNKFDIMADSPLSQSLTCLELHRVEINNVPLPNLRNLVLSGCVVNAASFTSVTSLKMSDTSVTGSLVGMINLKKLELFQCKRELLVEVSSMHNLEELSINSVNYMPPIHNLRRLKYLYLSSYSWDINIANVVGEHPDMEVMKLTQVCLHGNLTLYPMPKLRVLCLTDIPSTNTTYDHIVFPSLTNLSLCRSTVRGLRGPNVTNLYLDPFRMEVDNDMFMSLVNVEKFGMSFNGSISSMDTSHMTKLKK